jgi:hypothetical protein
MKLNMDRHSGAVAYSSPQTLELPSPSPVRNPSRTVDKGQDSVENASLLWRNMRRKNPFECTVLGLPGPADLTAWSRPQLPGRLIPYLH